MINSQIKIQGRTYKGKGRTIMEAIASLPVGNAKGAGVLTLDRKGVSKFKVLVPNQVSRLFGAGSPSTKAVLLKNTAKLFDKNVFEV